MDQLTPASIAAGLDTAWLAHDICYHESIGSTNDKARELALSGVPEGTLVIAEEQTAGRGRLQRQWHAPAGQALLFSLIFYPKMQPHEVFQLTMLSSLACRAAVLAQTGLAAGIKWPNDLLLKGRKLAGVLSEVGLCGEQLYVVMGIGLNVNVDFALWPELQATATSLRTELGRPIPRLPLLQAILRHIESGYDRLRAGISPYDEWSAHLATLGQAVRVTTAEETLQGVANRVDSDGALYLTMSDGSTRRVVVGDVERLR